MATQLLLAAVAILFSWTVLDVLLHRLLLAPLYKENESLWRPADKLNAPLIYLATFTLIGVFIGPYWLLVEPKSLGTGVAFGAFLGLALGVASGLGTYIHMPIPRPLAWAWLIAGLLRGIAAGAIVGALIRPS